MNHFLKPLLRILILRAKPQDLPASRALTHFLVGLFALLSLGSMYWQIGLSRALAAALIDTTLLVAPVIALLAISGALGSGYQALSAILGASIVLVIVMLLLGVLVNSLQSRHTMELAVLGWYVLVVGHVLRQAVSLPVLLGATFAFLYVMISDAVINALLINGTGTVG